MMTIDLTYQHASKAHDTPSDSLGTCGQQKIQVTQGCASPNRGAVVRIESVLYTAFHLAHASCHTRSFLCFSCLMQGWTPGLSNHGQNLGDQHFQLHRSSEGTGAASGDYDSLTKVYYSNLSSQELRGRGGYAAMQRTLYSRFTRVRLCTKSKQLTRR